MTDLTWAQATEAASPFGLREWYRSYTRGTRPRVTSNPFESRPMHTRLSMDIVAEGTTLWTARGFERLAGFIQLGDDPLMILALPNERTVAALRLIRDVVLSEGGRVIWVPDGALERSEIALPTLEVMHTDLSPHPNRADEQLIRAKVQRPVYGVFDSWGFRRPESFKLDECYFLSGYDQNEKHPAYFFCELPAGVKPTTVAEAYETLKPESVKIAEAEGRMVKRQGDMFFIRMPWWEPNYTTVPPSGAISSQRLHQSNHIAEEALWDGKLTLVRGRIFHAPDGRAPDHSTLDLGRADWWLCVRNTVPIVR